MVGTIVHQLTRNLTVDQIKEAGFDTYFVDHTTGVFPQFASGYPWSAATMQVTGDTIADLTEDLAAEQKARVTYDNILRLSARSCTSSASARGCGLPRKSSTRRMSTSSTPASTDKGMGGRPCGRPPDIMPFARAAPRAACASCAGRPRCGAWNRFGLHIA